MNCKPGDLAIIVRGENIGGLVDCISICSGLSKIRAEPYWYCRLLSDAVADIVNQENGRLLYGAVSIKAGDMASIADSYLCPLRGEPERIDEREPEELGCR